MGADQEHALTLALGRLHRLPALGCAQMLLEPLGRPVPGRAAFQDQTHHLDQIVPMQTLALAGAEFGKGDGKVGPDHAVLAPRQQIGQGARDHRQPVNQAQRQPAQQADQGKGQGDFHDCRRGGAGSSKSRGYP